MTGGIALSHKTMTRSISSLTEKLNKEILIKEISESPFDLAKDDLIRFSILKDSSLENNFTLLIINNINNFSFFISINC